jgi:hypothetical protein
MDEIKFSHHARAQMKERRILEQVVINCITKPVKLFRQKGSRFRAVRRVKRTGKNYLVVVIFDQFSAYKEVVTVFYTSKFQKYL